MKKFKLSTLFVIFTLTVSTSFYACKKYENGPGLSLRSRSERVAGTWGVENLKKNGNDITSLYQDYKETYTKSGDYTYNWGGISGSGNWAFQKEDEEIKLTGTLNQADHTLVIQKLKEDQFWYYYMDGTDKYEFHMVPR